MKYSREISKQQPEQAGLLYLGRGNDISALQCSNKFKQPPCSCCSYSNYLTGSHLSKEQSTVSGSKIVLDTPSGYLLQPKTKTTSVLKCQNVVLTILTTVVSCHDLWNIILKICTLSLRLVLLQVHLEAKHVKFRTVLNYKGQV